MGSFNALTVLLAPWGYCLRLCKILGKVWFGEWTEYSTEVQFVGDDLTTGEIWGIWFTIVYIWRERGGAGLLKNATSNDHDMQLIPHINPPNSGSKIFSKYLAMIIQKYIHSKLRASAFWR